jgi:phosphoribosyl 1,2-cyclic phosphodiesterase
VRFASLGSGSRGNATLIEQNGTRLLVDCGFSAREAERRLLALGVGADSLTALVVTHEHIDHVRGIARLAARYRLPVWMTPGTHAAWGAQAGLADIELFSPHEAFALNDLEMLPFPVPHDAREPCQFVVSDGAWRLALLSDAGRATPHMREMLRGCDALMLECNHDPDMLAAGPYPASVKRRISGREGHLSNGQAAGLLREILDSGLQHVIATHLSENNNSPQAARDALAAVLGCEPEWVTVAGQKDGFTWRQIIST